MSATNRGAIRAVADFYATPVEVISNFLEHHKLKDGSVFEPIAGNGNFVTAIRKNFNMKWRDQNHITAMELREEETLNLKNCGADKVIIGDFLKFEPYKTYQTIIGNPPYSLAMEFIEKCFEISDEDTEIIMLLRTSFLESKKRHDFWQKHPVNGLYVLSQRPSFTGHGTDATSYAFFVWNNSNKQEIKVI